MKTISLRQPLPISGPVHHPSEGPVIVDDALAEHLIESGLADEIEEDGEEDDDDHENNDGLEDLTVIDLGLLVTKEGVPLNGATKKADIIAAIRAHRAPAE